jgi:hypothetical protein
MDFPIGTVRSDDCQSSCFRGPCLVDMESWTIFVDCRPHDFLCGSYHSDVVQKYSVPEYFQGDTMYLTAGIAIRGLSSFNDHYSWSQLKPRFFPRQSCTLVELQERHMTCMTVLAGYQDLGAQLFRVDDCRTRSENAQAIFPVYFQGSYPAHFASVDCSRPYLLGAIMCPVYSAQ